MRTPQGQLVLIPNKEVFANVLTNYSDLGKRRVDLAVGVSYADDLEKVRTAAVEAIESITKRDRGRPVELFYDSFGDSAINFSVRFWIDFADNRDYVDARSEAVMRIKRAFDAAGITIPFPIRTLDFSPIGGRTLEHSMAGAGRGQVHLSRFGSDSKGT